jgi:hypothetical protein
MHFHASDGKIDRLESAMESARRAAFRWAKGGSGEDGVSIAFLQGLRTWGAIHLILAEGAATIADDGSITAKGIVLARFWVWA